VLCNLGAKVNVITYEILEKILSEGGLTKTLVLDETTTRIAMANGKLAIPKGMIFALFSFHTIK